MWTKQSVDDALKTYINDKARTLHLAIEIAELERRVNTAVRNLAGDEAGPKAQVITDMPHGTGVTNPTEQIAIKVASGWLPPEIRDMKNELQMLKTEYDTTSRRVSFVEAWLNVLSEREHWIMLHQYMQQEYWRDVLVDYDKQFGNEVTKDALKFLRTRAMKRIYKVAGVRN